MLHCCLVSSMAVAYGIGQNTFQYLATESPPVILDNDQRSRSSIPDAALFAGQRPSRVSSPTHGLAATSEGGDDANKVKLSSVGESTVNLIKNIVGAGMLSLPAGVAAFSSSPTALVPSVILTVLAGVISAFSFVLIADACQRTGESSYATVWGRAVSPNTSWLPRVACLAKAGIGCVSYSMILGDCLSRILSPLGLPALIVSREASMLLLTVAVIFPLCSLKSLAPLAKFSVLGVLSNVYIGAFILLRCFDGSYGPHGVFSAGAPVQPSFSDHSGGVWSTLAHSQVTVLLSILATAYLAHYNAPLYWEQLDPGPSGNKKGRFVLVSVLAFTGAAAIFSLVMIGGFLTFGGNSLGLILNNYAAADKFAGLARVAIALSLTTAYPLVFFNVRKQVLDLLGDRGHAFFAKSPKILTGGMLALITLVALRLHNLGKVSAFAGAALGSLLLYIGPALLALGADSKGLGKRSKGFPRIAKRGVSILLIPLGLVLGVVGAVQSLK